VALNSHIQSPKTSEIADVHSPGTYPNGLVVSTQPLVTYENQVKFFSNPLYGTEMNLKVGFDASPEIVYRENVEWTTATVSGTWNFTSPGVGAIAPYAGSVCINATATVDTDTAQFSKLGGVNLTAYNAITGYIALSAWDNRGTKEIRISGWAGGAQVGISRNIGNFINIGILNTWQKFTILLSSLNLTGQTIDNIRITTVDIGPGSPPDYFLDNIQIEKTATGDSLPPTQFTIEPDIGTWYYCHRLSMHAVDNYDITYSDATVPALSYNQILGVSSLSNGLIYRRIQDGITKDRRIFKDISDFLQFPTATIASLISDSTNNTMLTINFDFIEPILLKPETEDKIYITVSDDLSGLNILRFAIAGRKEVRHI